MRHHSSRQICFPFINCLLAHGKGVLLHCYAGVNRSGAVAAAYLAHEKAVPLRAAIMQLRETRGTVLTNQHFLKQLVHFCHLSELDLESVQIPAAMLSLTNT